MSCLRARSGPAPTAVDRLADHGVRPSRAVPASRTAYSRPTNDAAIEVRENAFDFFERYRATGGRALVLMMSAYGDDEQAIAAMQRGAYDYIPKPFRADQVLLVVRKAIERMDAQIGFESELGKGSKFWMQFKKGQL